MDDLPEDFLIDVVGLEETLLLTYGCGQEWEGWETVKEGIRGENSEKDTGDGGMKRQRL